MVIPRDVLSLGLINSFPMPENLPNALAQVGQDGQVAQGIGLSLFDRRRRLTQRGERQAASRNFQINIYRRGTLSVQ